MTDFETVLNDARKLSRAERLQLIEALWADVPEEADFPLSEEWAVELARRVKAVQAGTAKTIPWETIRDQALASMGHGASG